MPMVVKSGLLLSGSDKQMETLTHTPADIMKVVMRGACCRRQKPGHPLHGKISDLLRGSVCHGPAGHHSPEDDAPPQAR